MLTIPVETLTLGLESFALAFALSALLAAPLMALLRKLNAKQTIHTHAPESHQVKEGTPTMGGLIILAGLVPALVVNALKLGPAVYFIVGLVVAFAAIGFIDDHVVPRSESGKRGLGWAPKLVMQFAAATLAGPALGLSFHPLSWGVLVLFVLFFTNAFNFADGLDGLAIVPVAIVAACFGLFSYVVGHAVFSGYLQIPYVPGTGELAILCGALVGASMGFLWFNAPPAMVFMGDTGSLAMGGVLGAIAIMTKHELVLAIVGGLFVLETVSVIVQVASFKLTGKRVFRMAPLHHHFEKKGWSEPTVVIRFWIIAMILALIGLATLKLR